VLAQAQVELRRGASTSRASVGMRTGGAAASAAWGTTADTGAGFPRSNVTARRHLFGGGGGGGRGDDLGSLLQRPAQSKQIPRALPAAADSSAAAAASEPACAGTAKFAAAAANAAAAATSGPVAAPPAPSGLARDPGAAKSHLEETHGGSSGAVFPRGNVNGIVWASSRILALDAATRGWFPPAPGRDPPRRRSTAYHSYICHWE
jgi:hypothetical protein